MKTKKIKIAAILLVVMTIGFSFTTLNKITVKGSDTMVILSQKWAEVYMQKNPGATIQVTGGGSGVGIAALINGSTDIANSSRPMKASEVDKLKQRYNTLGIEIPCAKDGLSVYLNKANGVSELTVRQIGDIFSGKITNWKQVGGVDAGIRLYGRESSSGTFVFFKDNVVKTDYAPSCQTLPGTAAIVNAVKKDKYAIGYGGAAYAEGVKDCKVKKDDKTPGVYPTAETIKNKTYPITRYLYMYLKSRPTGETKKFVDWILSPEGQKLITSVGYFPVK
ncbi:phosphate ABC transporter substrate-binding protein [Flavobacterium sp. 123]|jgi:phosphate transport system substrate-binding protein|uniref:phosphate ABC transporter substrate-binding protein n=1 Tax=Flavobacterium sp. 123 TaxID=2135627 RepID=UPI000EB5C8C0|nr:phosphate ABC transporter substrate-binding protein [Flavobacterium sp. 123]RKS99170.1 phosphate ABC transporter substrate-binding protein (PhoT family) [Flavobacterium sp. 123]